MRHASVFASTLCLLLACAGAFASDTEELNDLYRAVAASPMDISSVAADYSNGIVSDGLLDEPLIVGKRDYIVSAIRPFAALINAGMQFDRTTYVVRRVESGDMVHDVGYFHSILNRPGGEPVEVVQKFSLVFMKERGEWKIITYFDAGTAPLDVLEGLEARYVID